MTPWRRLEFRTVAAGVKSMGRGGSAKNRRRHHRFDFPLAIEWARIDPATGQRGTIRHAATLDVSAGGLAFVADEPLPIGAPLVIDLHLPGAHHDRPRSRAAVIACLALAPRRYRVGLRLLTPIPVEELQAWSREPTSGTHTRSSALDVLAQHLEELERQRVQRARQAIRRTIPGDRTEGPACR